MGQPVTSPKIEELRLRLKSDPKSRLFYPLAEELRRAGGLEQAEQVLRNGLTIHPTYLSAWVGLGRILREQQKNSEAVEALTKALQLDPGNLVAARLLGDVYVSMGERVEAIKKYKLVYALLPGDQELQGTIARLDAEIKAPKIIPEPEPEHFELETSGSAVQTPESEPFEMTASGARRIREAPLPWADTDAEVIEQAAEVSSEEQQLDVATGDADPMLVAHNASPFEEPGSASGYGSGAFSIEQPAGMHLTAAPISAELPEPLTSASPAFGESYLTTAEETGAPAEESSVFEPTSGDLAPGIVTAPFAVSATLPPVEPDDFAKTITMADLYAKQGLIDEARDIYEDILARDPDNEMVRAKLDALAAPGTPAGDPEELNAPDTDSGKVRKLQGWLAKVKGTGVGGV